MRYHYKPIRIGKNTTTATVNQDVEEQKLSFIAGVNANNTVTLEYTLVS